ncbi:hypothetical protein B0T10DRAFT_456354 [Thelonectria olida]|uniref:Uncharacterized protein n=1 Tax=Thelonectria olida TaxID=1576542 RepID=A0A9P9AT92_9HYPO|nr:hypothetical protein B0T10DRAFT_456354 [Thelonectria olida]
MSHSTPSACTPGLDVYIDSITPIRDHHKGLLLSAAMERSPSLPRKKSIMHFRKHSAWQYQGFPVEQLLPPPDLNACTNDDPLLDKTSLEYRNRAQEIIDAMKPTLERYTRYYEEAKEEYVKYAEALLQVDWNLNYVDPVFGETIDRQSEATVTLVTKDEMKLLGRELLYLRKQLNRNKHAVQMSKGTMEAQKRRIETAERDLQRLTDPAAYSQTRHLWKKEQLEVADKFDALDGWEDVDDSDDESSDESEGAEG